jgi:hypothetical protein
VHIVRYAIHNIFLKKGNAYPVNKLYLFANNVLLKLLAQNVLRASTWSIHQILKLKVLVVLQEWLYVVQIVWNATPMALAQNVHQIISSLIRIRTHKKHIIFATKLSVPKTV